MSQLQQKPQAQAEQPAPPDLKVVENTTGGQKAALEQPATAAQGDKAATQDRELEAAARQRLHPARIWPD